MRVLVNAEKCTGCNSCELACSFSKAQKFNPKKARIKVVTLDYLGFSNPVVCLLCKKPKCVEACPKGALSQTETGTIHVSEDKCDGCQICVDECIVGHINFDEENGIPLICDLCGGKPMCVEWCPRGALIFENGKKSRGRKGLMVTLKKAKPFLREWGIPENELDWYKKFT
jgi:Fe-S-cluster-containing dehydrogenase component